MELSKLKIWAISTRPKTLLAAVGPIVIGAAMAFSEGGINAVILIITLAIQSNAINSPAANASTAFYPVGPLPPS